MRSRARCVLKLAMSGSLLLAACAGSDGSPPSIRGRQPSAAASAKTSATTTALDLAASAAPPSDATVAAPEVPCDFSRAYRGKIGDSKLSIVLSRSGDSLAGALASEAASGESVLEGTIENGKLTLFETADGKRVAELHGACARGSGTLSGTRTENKQSAPFKLEPEPAGAIGVVERARRIGDGDPDARGCQLDLKWPAVFGLNDKPRTDRINLLLKSRFPGVELAALERKVAACKGGDNIAFSNYSVETNERGVFSVAANGYVSLGPNVHGDFNAAANVVSIDIGKGRALALGDIVTSSKALRPVVKSCMKLVVDSLGSGDEWWFERDIQGVPTDKKGDPVEEGATGFDPRSLREPSFLVLPDGLAVLLRNQPTVSAQFELSGPVLTWAALARAGILDERSSVAALWAGVKPAAVDAPTCVRFFSPAWVRGATSGG